MSQNSCLCFFGLRFLAAAEDYVSRTTTWYVLFPSGSGFVLNVPSGLATPVNDIIIMNDDKQVPTGTTGEIWIRGPNVMRGYWHDQGQESIDSSVYLLSIFIHSAATDKVLTKDGWFKTGDLGYLDEEGFLYIRDRSKLSH